MQNQDLQIISKQFYRMNENDTNTRLLIQYLDGELQGHALAEVENKISNDPSLMQELENLKSAQMAIKSYGLRQHLGEIHSQMMQELKAEQTKPQVYVMLRNVFRIAAIIIVILGGVSVYQYYSLSSRSLFESNYQSYQLHQVRGKYDSSMLEQLYKQNLMDDVIDGFSRLKRPSIRDYFYLGNAYLTRHNASMAIRSFEVVQQKNSEMGTHILEDDVDYFLAMSYLQNNQPAKALPLLEKIHNDKEHLYTDKVNSWFLLKARLLRIERIIQPIIFVIISGVQTGDFFYAGYIL